MDASSKSFTGIHAIHYVLGGTVSKPFELLSKVGNILAVKSKNAA